jgi:hypothetical protein
MPKQYDMEYLIKKAKEYHCKESEEWWSRICVCGKTYGNHFGSNCHSSGKPAGIFIQNEEATEFFAALRQIVCSRPKND